RAGGVNREIRMQATFAEVPVEEEARSALPSDRAEGVHELVEPAQGHGDVLAYARSHLLVQGRSRLPPECPKLLGVDRDRRAVHPDGRQQFANELPALRSLHRAVRLDLEKEEGLAGRAQGPSTLRQGGRARPV